MGRPRTRGDLPRGMYLSRGSYFHTNKDGSWFSLGKDREIALERFSEASGIQNHHSEVARSRFARQLWKAARSRAMKRQLPFNITVEGVREMIDACRGKCSVSGLPFDYRKIDGKRSRPWIPSLDRIVPAAGYVPGNCRIVCAYVNMAINEFGLDALQKLRVYFRKQSRSFKEGSRKASVTP